MLRSKQSRKTGHEPSHLCHSVQQQRSVEYRLKGGRLFLSIEMSDAERFSQAVKDCIQGYTKFALIQPQFETRLSSGNSLAESLPPSSNPLGKWSSLLFLFRLWSQALLIILLRQFEDLHLVRSDVQGFQRQVFWMGFLLFHYVRRVDDQSVDLIHFIVDVTDQGEEGVYDGVQEAVCDPFCNFDFER